ncbi:MAG: DUF885 domain-containing protein [Alphaproteobacteria bacterium]|nr:DUF885 domain-containing protein [Alphaproteobacteria bacterium]
MRLLLAATAGLLATAPAAAAPADDFRQLLADHWSWWLSTNPEDATVLGDRRFDTQLGDPSLAGADAEAKQAQAFLDRLDRIPAAALPPADRTNRAILRTLLAQAVEANRYGQRAVTFNTYYGWHTSFAGIAQRVPLFTKADYESYIARLAAYRAYNAAAIATTRAGVKAGYAHPCEPLTGYEKTISGNIAETPEQSVFWVPFRARPATVAEADWADLVARGRAAIAGSVIPAYRDFLAYFQADYLPKCRKIAGVGSTPGGPAYYAFRARVETTTDMTPDAIHQLGLSEVARIRAAMDRAVADSGFKGTRAEYIAQLRADPNNFAKTPQELLEKSAWTAKQIEAWMPRLFGRLPRLPFTVAPIPAAIAEATTTAYYNPGQLAAGRPGTYAVNTSKLDQRPLYELPALTLHEAVPGHHHQVSLQQELDLPEFRRHAADFTAFVEGWALYAESLGTEMGLYDTPEKRMGQLSYEMWRACRLVVDTGLHAKGWTRDQAIQFMLDNTALTRANIEAEVNRYMTWPGQALGYKIGELTIKRLRSKAEAELGPRFDLRAFHDAVLENGAIPLSVLETNIDAWIATQKAAGKVM